MKRLLTAAVLPMLVACTSSIRAQMTTVTATQLKMGSLPVRLGTIGFTPVNAQGQPVAITVGGTPYNFQTFTATVSDGAIVGTFQVPDLAQAIPLVPNTDLRYSVQIYNATTKRAKTLSNVTGVQGAAWSLDRYAASSRTTRTKISAATDSQTNTLPTQLGVKAKNLRSAPILKATLGGTAPGTNPTISAISLGQNANLNGFKPFCPSPANCSAIYSDLSGNSVDSVHNGAFQSYYGVVSLHPDFIDAADTMPYYVLNTSNGTGISYIPTHCTANLNSYCTESDDTLLPLVSGIQQEGGTDPTTNYSDDGKDHHLAVIDQATGFMYDTYQAKNVSGIEQVYASSLWDLNSPIEGQHPKGRTSADAAGLPVGLGLTVRYEDILAGHIDHALRMTLDLTGCSFYQYGDGQGAFVAPASHAACTGGATPAPGYMGMRLRLKSTFDLSPYSQQNRVILQALKQYGFIVADNGGKMFFQGTYDPRFNQDDLNNLKSVHASDFEVIDTGNHINTAELSPEDASGGTSVATDQSGMDSTSAKGTVINSGPPPTIDNFQASASTITLGSSVTFNASASNGNYGFIDNAGPVRLGSSVTVTPTQTQTYTLTVLGSNGYVTSNPITVRVTGATAGAPSTSLPPGSYSSAQSVALATSTSGADIHYTTDGSAPACNSSVYTSPLAVTGFETISAIACEPGFIPSAVSSFTYKVHVPGSVPAVISQATSGIVEYATAISVPISFSDGDSALVTVSRTNDSQISSVSCGQAVGTVVQSLQTTVGANPTWMEDVYYLPAVNSGPQACTVVYASQTGRSRVFVTEVNGASGIDSADSSNVSTAYHGVYFRCGTTPTSGSNRLGFAAGMQAYAYPTAPSGYTPLAATGDIAVATIAIPSASTQNLIIDSQYTENYACISLTLKP